MHLCREKSLYQLLYTELKVCSLLNRNKQIYGNISNKVSVMKQIYEKKMMLQDKTSVLSTTTAYKFYQLSSQYMLKTLRHIPYINKGRV